MSENRIRKIDSTKTPSPARAPYGPASAGVEYDTGRNLLAINPDGVVRAHPNTFSVSFRASFANGATILTTTDFGAFFIAPYGVEVVGVKERHAVAGTSGSAVTLMVQKVPSGTSSGSGTDLLSAGIDVKGAADTNATGALSAVSGAVKLAAGDALAVVPTGTLTSLNGVVVTVEFKRRPDVA